MRIRSFFLAVIIGAAASVAAGQADRLSIRIVSDEAEAVLNVLNKRAAGAAVTEKDWSEIFASEGYVRLKQRELAMKRPFEDAAFRDFVMADTLLARRVALADTLKKWKTVDAAAAAGKALRYLPDGAVIKAKIYPVIKPRDNSFVFDVRNDPAVFLYLDPAVNAPKFENTLAHELHHIGFGTACPGPETIARIEKLSPGAQKAVRWLGAFGEGLAMLAAAGGPELHPHAVSEAEERERWDRDTANFDSDLRRVEQFLINVADGKLSGEEETKTASGFFGVQGPWYTVGWRMATEIERAFGRRKLIESFCDPASLPSTYNAAAARSGTKSARWSPELLGKLAK